MTNLSERIIRFYKEIPQPATPSSVKVMNPYRQKKVMQVVKKFYTRFFSDTQDRCFIFGINPGRFGAGITGIGFTDPINLEKYGHIENDFPKKHELSSVFMYEMIEHFGGAEKFYRHFFITAVSPLGFLSEGKNYNYYDQKELLNRTSGFIKDTLGKQKKIGAREVCFCLGEGKNFKEFQKFNKELKLFEKIIPLPHPRYIMQYKRKQKTAYIRRYLTAFEEVR